MPGIENQPWIDRQHELIDEQSRKKKFGPGVMTGRCGTCEHFPGNSKKCQLDTVSTKNGIRAAVYANDYGDGFCKNYEKVM